MARWNKRPAGYGWDRLRGAAGPEQSRNASIAVPIVAERQRFPDFAAINNAALPVLPALVARWLPTDANRAASGWPETRAEWTVVLDPSASTCGRARWADFALEDARGGDPVSLAAYLSHQSQCDAARVLAKMLGVPS